MEKILGITKKLFKKINPEKDVDLDEYIDDLFSHNRFEICDEMKKLRQELTNRDIEWHDLTDGMICRTNFEIDGKEHSVINGIGTYGGIDFAEKKNKGLLEYYEMKDDPVGYLTAKDVLDILDQK